MPIELGIAHYTACDTLDLDEKGMLAMGSQVTAVAQKAMFSFVLRLATQSGVTPWTMLGNGEACSSRSYQGSAIEVLELGPKEAKIVIVAQPLAAIRYWRGSLAGIFSALAEAFSHRAFVRELPYSSRTPHEVSYRLSWV